MSHSEETVKKQIRVYVGVFLVLAILTVLTVGVSYLHLPVALAVIVALAVACTKGSLVAAFFMHLKNEKPLILWILALTIFMFFFVLFSSVTHRL